eukprot:g71069.t1
MTFSRTSLYSPTAVSALAFLCGNRFLENEVRIENMLRIKLQLQQASPSERVVVLEGIYVPKLWDFLAFLHLAIHTRSSILILAQDHVGKLLESGLPPD